MSEPEKRTLPVDPVVVEVEKLVGGGRGLAHHEGDAWMVAAALPGEEVAAVARQRRAGVVEADTVAVRRRHHPARLAEPCPHAGSCGGCDWPHVEAAAGAALKATVAAEAGHRLGDLTERLAAAPVTPSPLAYRLRARLHWNPARGVLGFYGPRTWTIADIPACRLLSPRLAAARPGLSTALTATCPEPADLEWMEDLEGETAIVALRAARRGPPHIQPSWIPPASLAGGLVDGFWTLGAEARLGTGWGRATVTMNLPIPLEVPIGAFFQVNRHLARWLFRRVGELAGDEPVPTYDLYAGVGFLAAAVAARSPRRLELVEPNRSAAHAAQRNLPEARVAVGRTAEATLAPGRRLPERSLVLLDPPRAGLSAALRRALVRWRPQRVLMLSCDPATWARDTAHLRANGFRLTHVELVDLFPSTHHVEIVSVLETG